MKKIVVKVIILTFWCSGLTGAEIGLNGRLKFSGEWWIKNRAWDGYRNQFKLMTTDINIRLWGRPSKSADFEIEGWGSFGSQRWMPYSYALIDKVYNLMITRGYARYRFNKQNTRKNTEIIFSYGDLYRYSLNDPLIGLIDTSGEAWWDIWGAQWHNGIIFDTYNHLIPEFYSKIFIAHSYSKSFDATGARFYKKFLAGRICPGIAAVIKKWGTTSKDYNLVYTGDLFLDLSVKDTYTLKISAAGGKSDTPCNPGLNTKNEIMIGEVRFAPPCGTGNKRYQWGDFYFIVKTYYIGENFRNYLTKKYDIGKEYGRKGLNVSSEYIFPHYQIRFRHYYNYLEELIHPYSEKENKFEVYIEFKKNFKFLSWYSIKHSLNTRESTFIDVNGETNTVNLIDDYWKDFLVQLEMESKRGYVKLQYKIHNIGSQYLKYLYGLEYNLNITDKIKNNSRILFVDEIGKTRYTVWNEVKYQFKNDTFFSIGYGEGWYTDNDLVNDGDFVENIYARNTDKIYIYIEVNF